MGFREIAAIDDSIIGFVMTKTCFCRGQGQYNFNSSGPQNFENSSGVPWALTAKVRFTVDRVPKLYVKSLPNECLKEYYNFGHIFIFDRNNQTNINVNCSILRHIEGMVLPYIILFD